MARNGGGKAVAEVDIREVSVEEPLEIFTSINENLKQTFQSKNWNIFAFKKKRPVIFEEDARPCLVL